MKMTMSLVGVLILCAASVAQDAPVQPEETPIKPLELYKEVGRAWSYELMRWSRGGRAERGSETGAIVSVANDQASYRVKRDWRSGERHSETGSVLLEAEPRDDWQAYADSSLPRETLAFGFATFECARHVATEDGIQTTTWISVEYHPLVVRQVKLGKDSCEIKTLKSFDAGGVDPVAFFRVAGRSTTLRHPEGTLRLVVKAHTATTVTLEMTVFDKDGEVIQGPEVDTGEFAEMFLLPESVSYTESDGEVRGLKRTPWPVVGEETIKVEAGEFECIVYAKPDSDERTWISKHLRPLTVKEAGMGSSELIALDLGHDEQKLYRKAGNYSVTRSVTSFGELEAEAKVRVDVTSFDEGTAKVVTIYQDGNGNEQLRRDMDRPVKELELPAMPYNGQIEESVTTPAGTFRCIKTEANGVTTWTHHGVIVRLEAEQQGAKVTQELIELKME